MRLLILESCHLRVGEGGKGRGENSRIARDTDWNFSAISAVLLIKQLLVPAVILIFVCRSSRVSVLEMLFSLLIVSGLNIYTQVIASVTLWPYPPGIARVAALLANIASFQLETLFSPPSEHV